MAAALPGLEVRRADVSVVLSGHHLRFALVPWRKDLRGEAEWRRYAHHRFQAEYGELAATWDIHWSDDGAGRSRLACALPRSLAAALDELFDRPALKLVSLTPTLMGAFNLARKRFGREPLWFLFHEPGQATLAFIDQEGWRWLRSFRVTDETDVAAALPREALLAGMPAGKILVCSTQPAFPIALRAGWTVEWLPRVEI